MGQNKTIDQEALLDAVEAVVIHGGAGNLTFDAVARQAGASKKGCLCLCNQGCVDRCNVAPGRSILEDFLTMRKDS